MSKVMLIAWREFKHTALTKAFILGAIFTPVMLLCVVLLIPMIMKSNLPPLQGTLAVVDPTGKLAAQIAEQVQPDRIADRHIARQVEKMNRELGRGAAIDANSISMDPQRTAAAMRDATPVLPSIQVSVKAFDASADLTDLKQRVRDGEYLALVVVEPRILDADASRSANAYELFVPSDSSPSHTRVFQDAIGEAVVHARVEHSGHDLEAVRALVAEPDARVMRLTADGDETAENPIIRDLLPMGFMFLIWITTFTSGNYLLTSTIEEKSNKVIEVLLSAASPMQLMAGKILGQAYVSTIMLIMYGGLAIVGLTVMAMLDLVPVINLVYLVLYFVMAYFMIASIMAGVGSAVNELRDAQSLITPAMMVLVIPMLLWYPISEHPNGLLATVTSFIPPLIPFVMILRVTATNEPVATWQIVASLIIGFASMFGVIWMCARIFRVGVLMYGKPPSPLELIRWLRYS